MPEFRKLADLLAARSMLGFSKPGGLPSVGRL
jgi:hypothetical protein